MLIVLGIQNPIFYGDAAGAARLRIAIRIIFNLCGELIELTSTAMMRSYQSRARAMAFVSDGTGVRSKHGPLLAAAR